MRWILLFISLAIFSPPAKASTGLGYYHVAQATDGRWWFVDPRGKAFYSTGINNLTPAGDYSPLIRKSPYAENILKKYGSVTAWAETTSERLKLWGWNTLASWSDPAPFPADFAYTPFVGCATGFQTEGSVVPDYFTDAYVEHASQAAAHATEGRLGDHNILGYFLDNEMNWGHDYRNSKSLFIQYFGLPPEAPGKQAVIAELKERYSTIEALNAAWKGSWASWNELSRARSLPFPTRNSDAIRADESEALGRAARRYFQVCSDAIRKRDPFHLLLGIRTISTFAFPEVVEAEGETQDVVSVNFYEFTRLAQLFIPSILGEQPVLPTSGWLERFHSLTGKPILISEFGYKAFVPEAPGFFPLIFPTLPNQRVRAQKIQNYIQNTFNAPYIVGYHFFQWQDQPLTGRFDGEDSNWGLVNIHDEPYPEVTQLFQDFHAMIRAVAEAARF